MATATSTHACALKFHYVVSLPGLRQHKAKRDLKAADTEFLLQRYANLRVAYVDKASSLTKVAERRARSRRRSASTRC